MLKVTVTQEHVKQALQISSEINFASVNPISLAFKDKHGLSCIVDDHHISFGNQSFRYDNKIADWIKSYKDGNEVEDFTIELQIMMLRALYLEDPQIYMEEA